MKPKEIKKYVRSVQRGSQLAFAVRHILVASLGASFSVLAQGNSEFLIPAAKQASHPETVKFNSEFIHGLSVDVSQYFQGNPSPAGKFVIQVFVNGENRGRHEVLFTPVEGSVSAQPCFIREELSRFGIKVADAPEPDESGKEQCAVIERWITGAEASYQAGDFNLDLTVPQAYLVRHPRGYTDPASWDSGVTAALLDYNSNFYAQQTSDRFSSADGRSLSGNLGLLAGFNFYDWRLRKRINTHWTSGSPAHTQSLFTRLQRDISVLRSQLTLGDSTTSGDLFDSLTVRGIQLQSDDRMLPDGLRNYTPLIRGIAETNARVQVSQRGQTIYETTVPPGPFELSDVGAMGYGGDLQLTITEADGRERNQIIPFSAPPMLLHDGVSRFGITVGKLKDKSLVEEPGMAQGFYQYGLGNLYTLYGGGQFSDSYAALGLGHAFNTRLGGISMDVTRARSELKNGETSTGNSFNIGYSKYLDATATDLTLAAYRYSSKGFYSLRDATLDRYGSNDDAYRVDYRTRQRFTLSVGQSLWNGGRLNFSGNFYNYWDDRSSSRQFMLTYNKSERYFSWSASVSRTFNSDGEDINSMMLTVSVPLGQSTMVEKPLFSTLYTSVTHDSDGSSTAQANMIGSQGAQNELSYGVGSSVNKTKNDTTLATINGNVNYNSSLGQFGSTASLSNKSSQLSFSANGSLVAHDGGITLGPRLGDYPFAIVNAQGAEGAKMLNGYGSKIDANGYAIVPSLTPYRENTVAVNTVGLPATVDVLENESTVIPRMGAAVKVNVKTLVGDPIVLTVRDGQGNYLPIGTDILGENNTSLGIVGQGGMAFIRGWNAAKNNLYVKNSSGARICTIYASSDISNKIMRAFGSVIQVEVTCH
ncbi:fimbrial biogenesis outer membrane usher protein [Enterobacteriaceae bacterium H20N1]|uniref:Fimbrial biogenesis outer membrane usher protein n=1 Tax=Dryocola boscaweniae TaxID=2925397 RepID=A0A9X2W9N9_9ENTR|nr:fimbria/pilus outer membrane usher protein [Dryocola boscaweniae]MCT4703375.1 fimbrial biogenesis outer membrane usher protein [Dryocola boscaweniae]MCT4720543.1 fimbrial biogenesis outer membrane usher protein [Dryocola boscaweniae]